MGISYLGEVDMDEVVKDDYLNSTKENDEEVFGNYAIYEVVN